MATLRHSLTSRPPAIAAGWPADEVLTTIIELADNHALMLAANADLEGALVILRKRA
ncbi:hypothetical protein [Rhizobium laguerreae]|uniref:hypothetical protein n=1 Tax=Rhizobium laguerreae TaxID=1076926 RepID=UPI0014425711|nr:hypothetical protein [Rhizobium laguerreae]